MTENSFFTFSIVVNYDKRIRNVSNGKEDIGVRRKATKIIRLKSGDTIAVYPDASTEHHNLSLNVTTYQSFSSMTEAWQNVDKYKVIELSKLDLQRRIERGLITHQYSPKCATALLYGVMNARQTPEKLQFYTMQYLIDFGFQKEEIIETSKVLAQMFFDEGNIVCAAILYHFLALYGDTTAKYWLLLLATQNIQEMEDRTI